MYENNRDTEVSPGLLQRRQVGYYYLLRPTYDNHGCLGYLGRRRDCRIGTLSIKTSVFVQKREFLKIRLIVCICSARFGDRTTSLEFIR